MSENLCNADRDEPWLKMVGKRRMLIPTLEVVKASVEAAEDEATVLDLRQVLADEYGADSTCPVTIRRHLNALGFPVRRGTDRVKQVAR